MSEPLKKTLQIENLEIKISNDSTLIVKDYPTSGNNRSTQ